MIGFVIMRDRHVYAMRCVAALMIAGLDPVIVDQGSSYPPAVAWLDHMERSWPVLRHGGGHPRSLWGWPPFDKMHGPGRYLVSDPDVVPSDDCPPDWPAHLGRMLDAHPEAHKAGLGLRTDNIPASYARRDQVINWEAQHWQFPLGDGSYRAGVDTTLALYREGSMQFQLDGALRTGPPYLADHLAWHEDMDNLPDEIRYYYDHAEPGIAHWARKDASVWDN